MFGFEQYFSFEYKINLEIDKPTSRFIKFHKILIDGRFIFSYNVSNKIKYLNNTLILFNCALFNLHQKERFNNYKY